MKVYVFMSGQDAPRPLRYEYYDNFTGSIFDAENNHLMKITGKSAVDLHTREAEIEVVYAFWLKQAARSLCGNCVACCKILGVQEINKPANQWCDFTQLNGRYSVGGRAGELKDSNRQQAAPNGTGCTIYETRPKACRDFECAYITAGAALPEEFRPDNCRVMIWEPEHGQHFQVHVDVNYPTAWEQDPIARFLQIILQKKPLMIICGDNRKLIRGDHQVEFPVVPISNSQEKQVVSIEELPVSDKPVGRIKLLD